MTTRETLGQRLLRARSGRWTRPQLIDRIKTEFKKNISISTIQDLEQDNSTNPGVKTVEAVAQGLILNPLATIGLLLDDPPEISGYTQSQFAQFPRLYESVKETEKPFIDELINILIEQMVQRAVKPK